MVTVDLVVFAWDDAGLKSLFIRRKHDPFAGSWAIPGGYLELDEPIPTAALRELKEETGIDSLACIEEIGVFGDVGRDPRGRTISIAHAGVVRGPCPTARGGDDAADAAWLDPHQVTRLAFDHDRILARAINWLSAAAVREEVTLPLLPPTFTEKELDLRFRTVRGPRFRGSTWIRRKLQQQVIEKAPGSGGRYRARASKKPRP